MRCSSEETHRAGLRYSRLMVRNMNTRSDDGTGRRPVPNCRFRHLGRILPEAAGRAFSRKGFARARVITDWAEIVGKHLARHCQPLKIAGGVLTVRVTPSHALMVQHMEPVILERIGTFYGSSDGSIVERLKLKQGRVEFREPLHRSPLRVLAAEETAHLEGLLDAVDDPALKKALFNLGVAVMASGPRRTTTAEEPD